ncbi:alpha/beta fold hydrolase [Streptomyces sp. NPDC057616]|uniref:alpha/beta fold hydrolase n=1 Tax=Streptomyces sp. NPDC057616 TaxID=3346183 RepID=UPI0036BD2E84
MRRTPIHGDNDAPATEVVELTQGKVEYRLQRRGRRTVVVLHGGHMRAGLALGEDVFADEDCSVLVPSRPGYGRTPVSTGRSASEFADVTAALCARLGIAKITAVVGVSGGGPTAVAMAAHHPETVERLILQSAVGPLPWPDRRTYLGAHVLFGPGRERATWTLVRALVRRAPDTALRLLLRDLTTLPAAEVVAGLRPADRAQLIALFSRMRSGHGFVNDLRDLKTGADPGLLLADITQPGLVIASRRDGAVPFAHAKALAAGLRHAELLESSADSHSVWFGDDWPAVAARIRDFLSAGGPASAA